MAPSSAVLWVPEGSTGEEHLYALLAEAADHMHVSSDSLILIVWCTPPNQLIF